MKRSVLFVDDEELILSSLKRSFEGFFIEQGVELLTAGSGEEALNILSSRDDVTVLVSDLKMPGMTGSQLLRSVSDRYPDIILILLSGYSEIDEIGHSIKAGITAFIQKPWDNSMLKTEINRALLLHGIRRQNQEYHAYLEEEVVWTKRIQRLLLEDNLTPPVPQIRSIVHLPMENTRSGGDVFWSRKIDDKHFLAVIGDVAAHGVKGSYFALQLQRLEQQVAKEKPDLLSQPSLYLQELNDLLCDTGLDLPDLMVTLQVLVIDVAETQVRYSNAGHLPFLLLHEGHSEAEHLVSPGLGYMEGIHFPEDTMKLEPGDSLVMITDGLLSDRDMKKFRSSGELAPFLPKQRGNHWVDLWIENIQDQMKLKRFWDDVTVIEISL